MSSKLQYKKNDKKNDKKIDKLKKKKHACVSLETCITPYLSKTSYGFNTISWEKFYGSGRSIISDVPYDVSWTPLFGALKQNPKLKKIDSFLKTITCEKLVVIINYHLRIAVINLVIRVHLT